jgi:PIN domain nuclease of toxin-antitoxin system
MPVYAPHVRALSSLPAHHKDPFDRILVAQAMAEDLILITEDKKIMRYAATGLKVLV